MYIEYANNQIVRQRVYISNRILDDWAFLCSSHMIYGKDVSSHGLSKGKHTFI